VFAIGRCRDGSNSHIGDRDGCSRGDLRGSVRESRLLATTS
jgi:hypothetical protein